MASHRLAGSTGTHREDAIAAYLADLAAQLRGPQCRREAIIAELRDGLEQAIEDGIAAGLGPDQAAAAAIAQFGSPYARRTIVWFLATGPLVGIWWQLLLHPSPWRTGLIALVAAIPVIPLIPVMIFTAGGTLATTGRLMRWLPEPAHAAPWRPHRHRRAVHDHRPHHDHHVAGLWRPAATADDHRLCRQPDPPCLQHYDRATRQPDASLVIPD